MRAVSEPNGELFDIGGTDCWDESPIERRRRRDRERARAYRRRHAFLHHVAEAPTGESGATDASGGNRELVKTARACRGQWITVQAVSEPLAVNKNLTNLNKDGAICGGG